MFGRKNPRTLVGRRTDGHRIEARHLTMENGKYVVHLNTGDEIEFDAPMPWMLHQLPFSHASEPVVAITRAKDVADEERRQKGRASVRELYPAFSIMMVATDANGNRVLTMNPSEALTTAPEAS